MGDGPWTHKGWKKPVVSGNPSHGKDVYEATCRNCKFYTNGSDKEKVEAKAKSHEENYSGHHTTVKNLGRLS